MKNSAVHAYQFNQVLSIIFYMGPDIRIHLELILWIFWSTLICWGSSEWYTEMAEKAILIHYYRKSHYLNIKWFWSIFISIKIIILIKLQTKISSSSLKLDQSHYSARRFSMSTVVDQNEFLHSMIWLASSIYQSVSKYLVSCITFVV